MAASTFFIPSVNVIGADSLTDAMNMMADYGFTRTLIVTDNMLTKLGMAGVLHTTAQKVLRWWQPMAAIFAITKALTALQNRSCR